MAWEGRMRTTGERERTVVVDHELNISHYLGVAAVRFLGHFGHACSFHVEDTRRLGVQHERHREEAFDPF
jgi:hypothetical protein